MWKKNTNPVRWSTQRGYINTNYTIKVEVLLTGLYVTKFSTWNFCVYKSLGNHRYDIIIGHDMPSKIKLDLCLSKNKMSVNRGTCKGFTEQTKDVSTINLDFSSDWLKYENFLTEELWEIQNVMDATWFMHHLLDACY